MHFLNIQYQQFKSMANADSSDDMSFTKNVFKNGIYYNPATDHYPDIKNVLVSCDRCKIINLHVCVGWESYDLCLKCMLIINIEIQDLNLVQYKSQDRSLMNQNMYSVSDSDDNDSNDEFSTNVFG